MTLIVRLVCLKRSKEFRPLKPEILYEEAKKKVITIDFGPCSVTNLQMTLENRNAENQGGPIGLVAELKLNLPNTSVPQSSDLTTNRGAIKLKLKKKDKPKRAGQRGIQNAGFELYIGLWFVLTILFYFGVIVFDSRSLDGAIASGLVLSNSILDYIRFSRRLYDDRKKP